MKPEDREKLLAEAERVEGLKRGEKPIYFQILDLPLPLEERKNILREYHSLSKAGSKGKVWLTKLMSIPFGVYQGKNLEESDNVRKFIKKLYKKMDEAVFGHQDAKKRIVQILCQGIRNPNAKGLVMGIEGPMGNGKCFAKGTQILMYDGTIKNVEDIKIGEQIMGDDSKPRNIISLGSGKDMMYKIESNKGDSYIVNSEHILCLKKSGLDVIKKKDNKFKSYFFNTSTKKLQCNTFETYEEAEKNLTRLKEFSDNVVEIKVTDYLNASKYVKDNLKGYKLGVEFPFKEVNFDPYILGVWLGDGSTDDCKISNQDSKILYYLRTKLKEYDLNLNFISKYDYYIGCDTKQNSRKSPNKFLNFLREENLLGNKHIPNNFKLNSREIRLKVLAGLIDTDGYYNKTMKNYEIFQKSSKLIDDILFLARSLGFSCNKYEVKKSCKYLEEIKEGTYYRIQIYGDKLEEIPVLCERKKHIKCERTKNALVSGIKVTKLNYDNYYGFMIDGNQRFLLGDFTVTHNTSLIENGISQVMGRPFIPISLGGASDASFLDGHSFTYEGSIPGKIAEALIEAKCMNPIFYFDELDKVSKTAKGMEIINLLVHLIDPSQNHHFRDKYFHGVSLDLSKATFIFSFNDRRLVDRILLDRITVIKTKGLDLDQKKIIARY
jgi:hypothetical protein